MSKITRAIVIFLKFEISQSIKRLRNQYDPLAYAIAPHITLVFPFEGDISVEVIQTHIKQAIQGIKSFQIQLQGVTGSEEEYQFLNVKVGNDKMINLHDRLYTGPLETYLSREHIFMPHMTVGWFNNQVDFRTAINKTQNMNVMFKSNIMGITLIRVADNYVTASNFDFVQ